MRLFIAIELPDDIRRETEALSRDLMVGIPDPKRVIRWVKPDQFHLTLKFIGESPDAALAGLKAAMDQTARRHEPFGLGFGKLGSFKSGKFLRVLWMGAQEGAETAKALASELEKACQGAGFPSDGHPYHPHLTLARSKGPFPAPVLEKMIPPAGQRTLGPVQIDKLSLIQSVLSPQGPRYTTLYRSPLTF